MHIATIWKFRTVQVYSVVPHTNHMTNPTPLSPAADAVEDAAYKAWVTKDDSRSIAISTLRALADHVVAEDALYARSCCEFVGNYHRSQLLAIADELEAQQ